MLKKSVKQIVEKIIIEVLLRVFEGVEDDDDIIFVIKLVQIDK